MALDFKNPFSHLTKPQIYGVIGGVVILGGAFEYTHHKSTGSWNPLSKAATATGSAIDPVTNLPVSEDNTIDPITNLPYLAEAQQYGSVAAAEASVSAFGSSSATGSGIGVSPASPGQDGTSTPATGSIGSSTYTSNAAWATAATAGLADIGYPETDVATALGDYLTGTPVTPTQAGYIRTALAEFDNPPIGSFQIIPIPVSQPAPPVTPTSPSVPAKPTVKIPSDLIGQSQEAAFGILSAAGLHATGTPVIKGKTLIVRSVSPKEGTTVAVGSTVKLTSTV
jgi:PASTA domain